MNEKKYISRTETELLNSVFQKVFQNGKGRTILVSGENGIGKSSFIKNFIKKISNDNRNNPVLKVFSASAYCDGRYTDLYPWKELFIELEANIASLILSDDPTLKSEIDYKKIVRNVYNSQGSDWLKLIPVVGSYASQLLKTFTTFNKEIDAQKEANKILKPNLDLNIATKEDVFILLMSTFRKLAERHIVMLYIENIEYFDESSRNIFFELSKNLNQNPYRLILFGSYCEEEMVNKKLNVQTGEIENHPLEVTLSNLKKDNAYDEIKLTGFDSNQVSEFFQITFDKNEFQDELIKEIVKIANGNPFYLSEIIENLFVNGDIYKEGGVFKNNETINYMNLPSNIEKAIEERYKILPDDFKKILDRASVMGDDFSAEIISDMLEENLENSLILKLRKLTENYKIIEDVDKNYYELVFIYKFRHNLFQRYAYNKVKKDRMIYRFHNRIAEALESYFPGEKINIVLEQYNYHIGIGNKIISDENNILLSENDFLDGDKNNVVLKYLDSSIKLIESYEKTFSNHEAVRRCKIIVEISKLSGNKILNFEYTIKLGNILQLIGKLDESEKEFRNALNLSEELKDKSKIALSKFLLGDLYHIKVKDSFDEAIKYLIESKNLFEELIDKKGIARNLVTLGNIHKIKADYDAAVKSYTEAMNIRKESGDIKGVGDVYMNLGNIFYDKAQFEKAKESYSNALDIYSELNERQKKASVTNNLGNISFAKGELTEANIYYHNSLKEFEETGNKKGIAETLSNIGVCNYNMGNLDVASENYFKSLKLYEILGDKKGMAICQRNIGMIYLERSMLDQAMIFFTSSKNLNELLENKIEIAHCIFNIGEVNMIQNESAKALENFDLAISAVRKLGIKYYLCSFLFRKAEALFELKNLKDAETLNTEAHEIAEEIKRKDIVLKTEALTKSLKSVNLIK